MATFWDEGLQTSIYRLESLARTMGNAELLRRATDLENRLKNQWFPVLESIGIRSDALALGEELAKVTGTGKGWGPNVLYEEDTTKGGIVGTASQEAAVSGDIGANLSDEFHAIGEATIEAPGLIRDISQNVATKVLMPVGLQLERYGKVLLVALMLLAMVYIYLNVRAEHA